MRVQSSTADTCQRPLVGSGNGGGGWKLWRKKPHLDFLRAPPILAAAAAHGVTPMQISLRWSLQRGVVVVPMSTSPAHQAQNLCLLDFELTPSEMAAINALDAGHVGGGSTSVAIVGDPRSVYGFVDPDEIM